MTAACGGAPPAFHPEAQPETTAGSPLGPSYILVPLPDENDDLLGRVLLDAPEKGRSLEEISRPNECADKLTPKKDSPLASTFEDAQELAKGASAELALGSFGFEGDAKTATHFYYKLEVTKRVARTDTTEYVACCKEKGSCGYGFIAALVYGEGQYASASESSASGSVNIPVAGGAGGFVSAKLLHKRSVRGYVAALVTVTDAAKAKAISVIGDPAAVGITLTEQNLPDQIKARFDLQKVTVGGAYSEFGYTFTDGAGEMTENEFIRRYRATTGSNALDGAQHDHGTGLGVGLVTLGGALILGGGGYGIYYFATNVKDSDKSTQNKAMFAMFGGVVSLCGGLALILVGGEIIANADGKPSQHAISKLDADLYVAKYNRALLRRTITETREKMKDLSGVQVKPIVSLGFVGLAGSF
jgi:hypothetical protein